MYSVFSMFESISNARLRFFTADLLFYLCAVLLAPKVQRFLLEPVNSLYPFAVSNSAVRISFQ